MAESNAERPKRSWWSAVTGWLKESAALVGAVTTLVAAAAALVAIIDGDDDGKNGKKTPLPVVARLTGPGGVSERAFFSPTGMLLSTQYANQKGLSVVWRGRDGERTAEVRVDPRSDVSTGFTLLRLVDETGPERRLGVRNGASLKRGEAVKAYISPGSTTDGKVVAVGAEMDVFQVGVIDNLIIVGEVGRATEGGTPLLDKDNRVVGMLFAEEEGVGRTAVIPIEDIRAEFPEAFE
jgi:hypothetical protein